jgi:hypothetical protein
MQQLRLPWHMPGPTHILHTGSNHTANKVMEEDRAFHDWYRFVLSFPPHLVRHYIEDFGLDDRHTILDPFCGTGTTLVTAKLSGIPAIGLEANPVARFASFVKTSWQVDPDILLSGARDTAHVVENTLKEQGISDNQTCEDHSDTLDLERLDPEAHKLLLKDSISPLPLHKAIILLRSIREHRSQPYYEHLLLAFAKALVFSISNLRFGPEVGINKNGIKKDTPVIFPWLSAIEIMAQDLRLVCGEPHPEISVHLADARSVASRLDANSVNAVITSPPYPNEKDYTRTTRLELVLLGFISTRSDLRGLKKQLLRSNTRGVYKGDDDDRLIAGNRQIQEISQMIESRRIELGKTSGFERLYAKVARLYFGGMKRHLADLRSVLCPGAHLAYVVGDQASYLRVMIRTGDLLAQLAQTLGYEFVRKDLFRTRFSTATKQQLREEVVILRWPG